MWNLDNQRLPKPFPPEEDVFTGMLSTPLFLCLKVTQQRRTPVRVNRHGCSGHWNWRIDASAMVGFFFCMSCETLLWLPQSLWANKRRNPFVFAFSSICFPIATVWTDDLCPPRLLSCCIIDHNRLWLHFYAALLKPRLIHRAIGYKQVIRFWETVKVFSNWEQGDAANMRMIGQRIFSIRTKSVANFLRNLGSFCCAGEKQKSDGNMGQVNTRWHNWKILAKKPCFFLTSLLLLLLPWKAFLFLLDSLIIYKKKNWVLDDDPGAQVGPSGNSPVL